MPPLKHFTSRAAAAWRRANRDVGGFAEMRANSIEEGRYGRLPEDVTPRGRAAAADAALAGPTSSRYTCHVICAPSQRDRI